MSVNKAELLNSVSRFYQETFRKDEKGKQYLKELGFHDEDVFARFKLGYANGSLLKAIPSKGSLREDLKNMGLLEKGREYFYDSIVFPIFDKSEDCVGLIGKRIVDGQEIFLSEQLEAVFNWKTVIENKTLLFTDTMLDALTLYQLGYFETIPLIGEIPESLFTLIKTYNTKKVYLLLNNQEKTQYLSRKLDELRIACYKLNLAEGVNIYEYIHKCGHIKENLEKLIASAEPIASRIGKEGLVKISEDLIVFEFSNRKYQVKELDPEDKDRLRVNIRAINEKITHIDTMDLYVSRSRAGFIKAGARLFDISHGVIEQDLSAIIQKLEKLRNARNAKSDSEQSKTYQMTQDEEEEAMAFLKQPNILEEMVKHLDIMGYVGEDLNSYIQRGSATLELKTSKGV